ncbi:hypothetical protein [Variovorax davisae]|uniref:hypothetical protein n=1 Tax=Variovorax davisae TaxID=3053515 RepID=UPI003365B00F
MRGNPSVHGRQWPDRPRAQHPGADPGQAASRYLKELAGAGVLSEIQAGKEKLFIHPKLMQLLMKDSNDFAKYA